MPEDTPGEEQRTMLSFTEAAERLVKEGVAESMTAEGLRRLARDPLSGWPIGPADYRVVGKTRMLPYEPLVPYIQGRRRGRGPAKQPPKKRAAARQQGAPMDAREDLYASVMQGKEHSPAVSERASQKIDAFRAAVLLEAADALDESETLRDLTDDHMHDVNAAANELRRMAEESPEPSDG